MGWFVRRPKKVGKKNRDNAAYSKRRGNNFDWKLKGTASGDI